MLISIPKCSLAQNWDFVKKGIRNVEDLLAAKGEKVVRVTEVGRDTPGTDLELLPKEH